MGRPRKPESEKIQYQHIAVYKEDYEELSSLLQSEGRKIVDVFKEMKNYYIQQKC